MIRGLSLTQPYATLIAIGAKRIETRDWPARWRGTVAIHATKSFLGQDRALVFEEPFYTALHRAGLADVTVPGVLGVERLPQGAIVAMAELYHCGRIQETPGGTTFIQERADLRVIVKGDELEFGNYTPGRFAFLFKNVRKLDEPIPCRGMYGFWPVPPEIAAKLEVLG